MEVATATGKVVKRVGGRARAGRRRRDAGRSTALVANFGDDTVTEIHLPSLVVGPTVRVGRQPVAVAVTPDGQQALVVDFQDGTVTPVALPSLSAGAAVPVGPEPVAVFMPPSGTEALVADFPTSSLTRWPCPRSTSGPAIPLGANPTGIAAAPGGHQAWVSAGVGLTPVSLDGGRSVPPSRSGCRPSAWPSTRGTPSGCAAATAHWSRSTSATGKVTRTVALDGIPAAVVVTGRRRRLTQSRTGGRVGVGRPAGSPGARAATKRACRRRVKPIAS